MSQPTTTASEFVRERVAYWTALADENRRLGYADLEARCRQFAAEWGYGEGGDAADDAA